MILEYRYDASSESIAASDSPHLNAQRTHLLVTTLYYANSMRQATITDDQESSAQVEVGLRGAKDVMKILCGLGDEFTIGRVFFIQYYISAWKY